MIIFDRGAETLGEYSLISELCIAGELVYSTDMTSPMKTVIWVSNAER